MNWNIEDNVTNNYKLFDWNIKLWIREDLMFAIAMIVIWTYVLRMHAYKKFKLIAACEFHLPTTNIEKCPSIGRVIETKC